MMGAQKAQAFTFQDFDFPEHANYPTSDIKLRDVIYRIFHGECYYSGRSITLDEMVLDHVYPKALGGPDNYHNYVPTVAGLNGRKTAKFSEDFCRRVFSYTHLTTVSRIHSLLNKSTKKTKVKTPNYSIGTNPTKALAMAMALDLITIPCCVYGDDIKILRTEKDWPEDWSTDNFYGDTSFSIVFGGCGGAQMQTGCFSTDADYFTMAYFGIKSACELFVGREDEKVILALHEDVYRQLYALTGSQCVVKSLR